MIARDSAFFQRSCSVAEAFLQSAVIVDDHIGFGPSEEAILDELDVEEKVLDDGDAAGSISGDTAEAPSPYNPIDGKALVDAFAKKGIVCGLVQPGKDELDDLPNALRNVLVSADIAIVDWFLHSNTDCAQAVATSLIQDAVSSEPNRPRYIVIYSGNPKLETIAPQLGDRIKNEISDCEVEVDDFEISCGSCRIAVFAKAKTLVDGQFSRRAIDEEELPDRVVSDFAQEYCGLVSNVALASITAVRRNTHGILGRLSRDLDGAFLTHRALSEVPDEAQGSLRRIVAEELEAVLEDEGVSDEVSLDVVREWIDARGLFSEPLEVLFGTKQVPVPVESADDLLSLLRDGVDEYIASFANLPSKSNAKKNPERTDLSSVLGYEESLDFPDERFAALCTLKPRYATKPPLLTLGTIVKRKTRKGFEFLVCVQPKCDAVLRKGNSRQFLFLPLEAEGNDGFCTVVPDGKGFARLLRCRSPFNLRVFEFEAASINDIVVRAKKDHSGFYFTSVGLRKRKLRWCGQLKDIHAQNVAQRTASRLARVGHNTSAWLRRSTSKQVRDT